ncbi:MAG: VIT1/CCC1 transporter family protein [Anaerolineae bacterium]|jgi:VIT1/CCC1 family predicted Fe2+/Mn2+ transporter
MPISQETRERLLVYQEDEITEHHVYAKLAKRIESPQNRRILEQIAEDELRHYHTWQEYTHRDVKPNRLKIWKYCLLTRIFGLTFGAKLMERSEQSAQKNYVQLRGRIREADAVIHDENEHESALLELLDEERLRYTSSIVLGLNDALVELTGTLAGLTWALRNTRLIALTGLITGIAAALSMGASEYLSTKSEQTEKHPFRASIYTGSTYILTVLILILPYLVLDNFYVCLACTLLAALLVIALFNYYLSIAKDLPFKERFREMAGLSFGVAVLSFLIGFIIRSLLGVEI